MFTHSVHCPVVVASPESRGSRHANHLWLAISVAFVAVLFTAAYFSATRARHDASASSSSPDASIGVVTSFGMRRTHNGRYSAEIISASPIAIGLGETWTVHISRRSHLVSHASVKAHVWMPESDEHSPAASKIRYVGDGNYRIDNVLLTRAGWWNIALVIDGNRGTDSVAFNVIIPSPSPSQPEQAHMLP
jgi:hypothetical protein